MLQEGVAEACAEADRAEAEAGRHREGQGRRGGGGGEGLFQVLEDCGERVSIRLLEVLLDLRELVAPLAGQKRRRGQRAKGRQQRRWADLKERSSTACSSKEVS
jgi:hypothetical protein